MHVLPDVYPYKQHRVEGRFRQALCGFTKELMLADPQNLLVSARLIQQHRYDLEYLRELIDWRLKLCDQDEDEWNQDNPFYWRAATSRREVPPDEEERLSELYLKRELDEAESFARLLIDCWDNYAEGWSYLGLIAMDREDLDRAVECFETAIEVGRKLFPKRIDKDLYWTEIKTRPYIRALVYLAQTRNRRKEYGEAVVLCDRLDKECGQDLTAATERIPVFLNTSLWEPACQAARFVHNIYPQENLPLAFAYFEAGDRQAALAHFLCGALHYPITTRMVCGLRTRRPKDYDQAQDHNHGVELCRDLDPYLSSRPRSWRKFFRGVLKAPEVVALLEEKTHVEERWQENRTKDRSGDRTWYRRMMEMRSVDFARRKANELAHLAE